MLNPGTPPKGYQWHLMPDGNWELLPVEPEYIPVIKHDEDFE